MEALSSGIDGDTLAYRFGVFRALGFDIPTSIELAGSHDADWHEVKRALGRGCSLEQAARIFI